VKGKHDEEAGGVEGETSRNGGERAPYALRKRRKSGTLSKPSLKRKKESNKALRER